MNQTFLQRKTKREINISIGFVFEIVLFMLAGFFFAYGSPFGFVIFLVAIWLAFVVGDMIAKNSVLNFKWSLN